MAFPGPNGSGIPRLPPKPREPAGFREPARPPPGSKTGNFIPIKVKESFAVFGCSYTDDVDSVKKQIKNKLLRQHPDKRRNHDSTAQPEPENERNVDQCIEARNYILKWYKTRNNQSEKMKTADLMRERAEHHEYLKQRSLIHLAYKNSYDEWRKHILSLPFYTNATMKIVVNEEVKSLRSELTQLKRDKNKLASEWNTRIRNLESHLKGAQEEIQVLRTEKLRLEEEVAHVKPNENLEQISPKASQVEQLEKEKAEFVSKIKELEKLVISLQTDIAQLRTSQRRTSTRTNPSLSQSRNATQIPNKPSLSQQRNGERPSRQRPRGQCSICGKSISRRDDLKRHYEYHASPNFKFRIEPGSGKGKNCVACSYCGYTFVSRKGAKRHEVRSCKLNPDSIRNKV